MTTTVLWRSIQLLGQFLKTNPVAVVVGLVLFMYGLFAPTGVINGIEANCEKVEQCKSNIRETTQQGKKPCEICGCPGEGKKYIAQPGDLVTARYFCKEHPAPSDLSGWQPRRNWFNFLLLLLSGIGGCAFGSFWLGAAFMKGEGLGKGVGSRLVVRGIMLTIGSLFWWMGFSSHNLMP